MTRSLSCAVLGCLLGIAAGCGEESSACRLGQKPNSLYLSANPTRVVANGTDLIRVNVTALDEKCAPLQGQSVLLSFTDQVPEDSGEDPTGVGSFPSDATSTTLTTSALGAQTTITSAVSGTATLTASTDIGGTEVAATPIPLTFTSQAQDNCSITIVANPPSIVADGASRTTLTATVTSFSGAPVANGTEVTFTTSLGQFPNSDTTYSALASSGVASVSLQSDKLASTASAQVTATFVCDDPNHSQKSNQRGVPFTIGNEPWIELNSSANEVLADDMTTVTITGEVYRLDGTQAGAGETVSFITNLGRFSNTMSTIDATTDANGQVEVTFVGGATGGTATIQASVTIDQKKASDSIKINVRQVGFVEFISANPPKLGTKGSGVNETSQLTFKVKDTSNQPFPNVLVLFTKSIAQGVTLEPLEARTDAVGIVTTRIKSGTVANTVTVTATAMVGLVTLTADSAAIAIVGAKPSARSLTFSCAQKNVPGLVVDNYQTKCLVLLADRYSNKIGFATNVTFMSEAGQIDPSAVTKESGVDMGSAEVNIRTAEPRPRDVPPIPDEPFIDTFEPLLKTHNPRDGLVAIIAATTGEEDFTDKNGNGVYDAGEVFVDLGEPFVDENDNNVKDVFEDLWIDTDNDGEWDPPNGQWDRDTNIWRTYWMVWTGRLAGWSTACICYPDASRACPEISSVCPSTFSIARGGSLDFTWQVKDQNLNPLNATTTAQASVKGDKPGTIEFSNPPLPANSPDALGILIELKRVNDRDAKTDCTPTDPYCFVVSQITGYWAFGGEINVMGRKTSDTDPSKSSGAIEVKVTYQADGNYSSAQVVGGEFL